MRTLALAALLLLCAPLAPHAEEAKDWSHHMGKIPFIVGYAKGMEEAKKASKPMMVYVTAVG